MKLTPQEFRKAFPAFLNPTCPADHEITFWMELGKKLTGKEIWCDLWEHGVFLFTAHFLALEFNSQKAGKAGNMPGQVIGVVTSGSVDKVSFSRDASAAMDTTAGHWNLTTYGLQYRRLVLMVGAKPMQVSPNQMGAPAGGTSMAWPGVIPPTWN